MSDMCITDLRKQLDSCYGKKGESVCNNSELIKFLLKNKLSERHYEEKSKFTNVHQAGDVNKEGTSEEFYLEKNRICVQNEYIAYRYEILKVMGKGTFGTVIKAFDHTERRLVAIKVMKNNISNTLIQNEIHILTYMRNRNMHNSANVVHLLDVLNFKNTTFLVFELMWIDLYELLRRNKFKGCSLRLVQKFCFSLLVCLNALYDCCIIHGDLKPENIMLKKPGYNKIKVIDFNCSCFEDECLFTYFQSRYYRAPEIILGAPYNVAIDMWSLGCVLAEIHSGKTLLPGEDSFDQIALIMELKGMPPKELLNVSTRAHHYITPDGFPRYCNVVTSLDGSPSLVGGVSPSGKYRQLPGTRKLSSALDDGSNPSSDFIDFIDRCLEYDPNIRMKPSEALQHDWLKHSVTE